MTTCDKFTVELGGAAVPIFFGLLNILNINIFGFNILPITTCSLDGAPSSASLSNLCALRLISKPRCWFGYGGG